jgi:uncharacterized secreted repeat protein (TIGR03808 family)
MHVDRRRLLSAGLGAAAAAGAGAGPRASADDAPGNAAVTLLNGLEPNVERDQSIEMQAAIDACTSRGRPLTLPPGRFRVGHLELRPGACLRGAHGLTTLEFTGGRAFLTARDAAGVRLEGLVLDGGLLALDPSVSDGLVALTNCDRFMIRDVEVSRGLFNGLSLRHSSGCVTDTTIRLVSQTGLLALDCAGLEIAHNLVADCGNNGVQVWRERQGEDGTIVSANRIERIEARAGGSGENGNGINVFRAHGVLITGNRIAGCAYSAIRANEASNVQMVANNCARLGEVALYAEFGFEGALIANNLVDGAATGIAVTNFDVGGRLAVVTGNLIRRLARREAEAVDKRGDGISVEADAVVSANVVEGAPNAGIVVGWGRYMRDVAVTGNLVRDARVGIMVTSDPEAGACLISQNVVSGAREGAIRAMTRGTVLGPDLAREAIESGRISIRDNLAA